MSQRQQTILLVEDDELIRDFTLNVLADAGYTTAVVYHPDAVPGALRRAPADLILADSSGAGLGDVWPALDAVRSAAGATPVLIFSAHNPERFAGYDLRGFVGVVSKPFTIPTLLDAVQAALLRG
jgi:CheY-like chemotaxis protein